MTVTTKTNKMKVSELRIGNWCTHPASVWSHRTESQGYGHIEFQWEEKDWLGLAECTMSIEDVEPIPLTEEWLKRLGFEIKKGAWGTSAEIRIGRVRYVLYQNGNVWSINPTDGFRVDFKYIHTVQNHYFALTGGELTY